jgi:ABC-type Fe3+/spermidine/putrescine transport system ATPase subunit
MATLSLVGISKTFDNNRVVRDINLDVRSGELFSILGPSGCGKTTLLRMIAGFETPTEGRVLLGGRDITLLIPQQRRIGMVFQNYALFPHMTVFENVAFGLDVLKLDRAETRRRVGKMLEVVRLSDKAGTPVPRLSGGEQQRVAVARALVVEPEVLLFDEPLSNLDVALRASTREEIRTLQRKTGITCIYVTHDQMEAMSLSDRVAVMRHGRVEQAGPPVEIYERPASAFVAEFLGGANILPVKTRRADRVVEVGGLRITVPSSLELPDIADALIAVKPEGISLVPGSQSADFVARIESIEFLGFTTMVLLSFGGLSLRAAMLTSHESKRFLTGMDVGVVFDWSRCHFFDGET